jgi:lipid A 3-O-deacylase
MVFTYNQRVRNTIVSFLLSLVVALPACAQEGLKEQNQKWLSEIRMGILAHDVPVWSRTRKESGVDFNAELIFGWPNCSILTGLLRSNLGFTLNNQGDTSKIYSGFLWEHRWQSAVFLDLGLGLAAHNGKLQTNNDDKKELGSRILFRIPVELGFLFAKHHGVSIMFAHVSNAYLADPNEGLDVIGLRYSYRF